MIGRLMLLAFLSRGYADLSSQFTHYETLRAADLSVTHRHHVERRSVHIDSKHKGRVQDVRFDAFGKHWELLLTSIDANSLLSPDFKTEVVGPNGERHASPVDPTSFYHGAVNGELGSEVRAYWDGPALSAVINSKKDTLYIEPLDRFDNSAAQDQMIVYRARDVNGLNEVPSKCKSVHPESLYNISESPQRLVPHASSKRTSRYKRQGFSPFQTKCTLFLVADFEFYSRVCGSQEGRCISYLIAAIDSINQLYEPVKWDDEDYTGFGFEIKKIQVRTTADNAGFNQRSVNNNNPFSTPSDLLEAFSSDRDLATDMNDVCLAHLFTAHGFSSGTLGLAYIAAPRQGGVGGICSPGYQKSSSLYLQLNTAWSTAMNRQDKLIPRAQLDLVTAHELGHNWGSEHDPDTRDCSPSGFNGGKFIMYTYSVEGKEQNNKFFSPCSRRTVGLVIRLRAPGCFTPPGSAFCGNHLREENEECDAGLEGTRGNDPCCSADCKYKSRTFQCSDANDICCKNCMFADNTMSCADENVLVCRGAAYCVGGMAKCGDQTQLSGGETCVDSGQCVNGQCRSRCEQQGRGIPCLCEGENDRCKVCCSLNNSTCTVLSAQEPPLPAGRPCVSGFCDELGKCKNDNVNLVERIWDIIIHIDANSLVEFMRSNIVGTVIVLSLFIWIPASCIVCCIDRRRSKADKKARDWNSPTNEELVLPRDRRAVRSAARPLSSRHALRTAL